MTKCEAMYALVSGHSLTHRFFSPGEFITSPLRGATICLTEGYQIDWNEFWNYRTHKGWDAGWSILNATVGDVLVQGSTNEFHGKFDNL